MSWSQKWLCILIRIRIALNWIIAIFFAFCFAITGRMYMSSFPVSYVFVIFTCVVEATVILPYFLESIKNAEFNKEGE
ncbi:hypothetical protein [Paenibacillus sp. FSL K6-2524]|uniref:hypothetical protein n=1 Tax=Paenibacillus sp. FSL K6-2524 TaxID=2954516 RepID=UPI0030FC1851